MKEYTDCPQVNGLQMIIVEYRKIIRIACHMKPKIVFYKIMQPFALSSGNDDI